MNYYLSFSICFVLGVLIAKPYIAFLRKVKSVQSFREKAIESHAIEKAGTPTMGGVIFLVPICLCGIMLFFNSHDKSILWVLMSLIAGALMGGLDDFIKILQANYKGLDSKAKLVIQFIVSSLIVYLSERYLFADITTDLPSWMGPIMIIMEYLWAFCVIAGTSNAINLSDGLDGLASMLSICAFAALVFLLYGQGYFYMTNLCICFVAGLLAFLVFNYKPAKVFMGDTGSLAIGMSLGAIAYITRNEWYLLIFALVPVIETVSVILQVASAKLSRKFLGKDWRIFKMAPLHHHFELCGIPELAVVWFFTGFQLVSSLVFFLIKFNITNASIS